MCPMSTRPTLEYTLVKEKHPGRETRHLLIQATNGPGSTNLFQLNAGVKTDIATGKEYEMRQKAEALLYEWT